MPDDLVALIRSIPEQAFREPENTLDGLTCLERLRWLQQTAWFIWRHKGAANRGDALHASDWTAS
jgi:hypothetical protein